jgi:hypothetical protein
VDLPANHLGPGWRERGVGRAAIGIQTICEEALAEEFE